MTNSELEQLTSQLQISGFCVLPGVIVSDQCQRIRDSVTRTVDAQRENYPGALKNVGFTPSLINHDQSFADYLADERLLALIQHCLGSHIRISFTSAIINEPGNERGDWHADWPFNQKNAGHVSAPYADVMMHITTLWMLSPFEMQNGGTLVLPESHRSPSNPTAPGRSDARTQFPTETNATGSAGSVLVMDSRLWHATAPNRSAASRIALAVRYAPWWLNLEVLRPESDERQRMCDESGKTDNLVPSICQEVFEKLPPPVQQLYRHWVR